MSTATDLFTDVLTDIGQLGTGQSASPEQISQAMRFCNRILGKWSVNRFMLFTVGSSPYVLTPGTQDYTLGPTGATFTGARPTFVESAQVQLPGSLMWEPLNLLDRTKWGAIRDKGATCSTNGLPQDIWVEYSYPNLGFHLWTIPANACTVQLATWAQLQQFATPFDELELPVGYEECLVKALACALCPAYDMAVPQSLYDEAVEAIAFIQRINAQSLGGALGESQTLASPNQVLPPPTGGGAPGGQ